MRENGQWVRFMGKARCNGKMEVYMKEIISKAKNRDSVDFLLRQRNVMRVHGKMGSRMVLEYYSMHLDSRIGEVYGNRENLSDSSNPKSSHSKEPRT